LPGDRAFPYDLDAGIERAKQAIEVSAVEHLFIVEDQASDLRIVADLAASLGAVNVEARTSASAAIIYLQSALEGKTPIPDVMVVDLDLGYESGFELLRFWHANPRLAQSRLVVWTIMGAEQREICQLFKVDAVVSKADGPAALKRAIKPRAQVAS
jgi:CheY-like chemotaxis protein